jgi:hypothetical protein
MLRVTPRSARPEAMADSSLESAITYKAHQDHGGGKHRASVVLMYRFKE